MTGGDDAIVRTHHAVTNHAERHERSELAVQPAFEGGRAALIARPRARGEINESVERIRVTEGGRVRQRPHVSVPGASRRTVAVLTGRERKPRAPARSVSATGVVSAGASPAVGRAAWRGGAALAVGRRSSAQDGHAATAELGRHVDVAGVVVLGGDTPKPR